MEYQYLGLIVKITESTIGKPFVQIFMPGGYRLTAFGTPDSDKSREFAEKAATHLSSHLKSLLLEVPTRVAGPIASLCAQQDAAVSSDMIKIATNLPTDAFWNELIKKVDNYSFDSNSAGVDYFLARFIEDLMLTVASKGRPIRLEAKSVKLKRRQNIIDGITNLAKLLDDHDEYKEISLASLMGLSEREREIQEKAVSEQMSAEVLGLSTCMGTLGEDQHSLANYLSEDASKGFLIRPSQQAPYIQTTFQHALESLASKLESDVERFAKEDGAVRFRDNGAIDLPIIMEDLTAYQAQPGTKGPPNRDNLDIRILCEHFVKYTGGPRIKLVAYVMRERWPDMAWDFAGGKRESADETYLRWIEKVTSAWQDYRDLKKKKGG